MSNIEHVLSYFGRSSDNPARKHFTPLSSRVVKIVHPRYDFGVILILMSGCYYHQLRWDLIIDCVHQLRWDHTIDCVCSKIDYQLNRTCMNLFFMLCVQLPWRFIAVH